MAYRNIVISSNVHLGIKNEQLIVSGEADGSVPVEDIRTLLIESRTATISTYALSFLAQKGVCVYVCDDKHLPCGILTPFSQHSRQKKQIELQFAQTKPKLKNIWSEIVVFKILNQAKCLELCNKDEETVRKIRGLSKRVLSGDTTNVESQAAAMYFLSLFGRDFSRNDETSINFALNYGYAIIRGYICRTIAKYGFEPSVGIHHCSQLNNFNLADDLIEPFRPIVDLFVAKNVKEEFDKKARMEIVNILNYEILINNEKHSVAYAIELVVQSLINNFTGEKNRLSLPILMDLLIHEYE